MKKMFISSLLICAVLFSGCGNKDGKTKDGSTPIVLWTFMELHAPYYEEMAKKWNEKNPDRKIKLTVNVFPYEDMHTKLGIALQSGKGAPDLADIEISRYANFLKGDIGLIPLNNVIEPEIPYTVKSRFDIYSKDGNYYGIDFHVGAVVTFYNKEIMDQAGVNIDSIVTWDDYAKAAKQVLTKTGVPMTTVEFTDHWNIWPMLVQSYKDYVTPNGKIEINSPEMLKIMSFWQNMIKEGTAVVSPGGFVHSEDYYGFMNNSGAASLTMPLWYMNRFTQYMPDLKNKITMKPMPVWDSKSAKSAGLGGTGTAVTKYSKNQDLAKDFLVYAKLSEEGNIEIWRQLGFDVMRTSLWTSDIMKEENQFTTYFINNPYDVLNQIGSDIPSGYSYEKSPPVIIVLNSQISFQIFEEMKNPKETLDMFQKQLENEVK